MRTHVEIDFNNEEHFRLFHTFYHMIYVEGFPDEDERESLENIIKQAKYLANSNRAEYHCGLACVDGQPVGGIIGDYFAEGNCGVVEFLIVSEQHREKKVGKALFAYLMERFQADAGFYGYTQGVNYCFFETENPWRLAATARKKGIERLHILSRIITGILEMEYIQPPLEEGKQSVDYLYLGVCVLNRQLSQEMLSTDCVRLFLKEYFRYAFHIDDVEENPAYVSIMEKLTKNSLRIVSMKELV